ncbi:hypothetical protein HY492_02650 [Candidatus Woesearchaeota archaeon]|nr:hypothetical protein [Candidatus Woesearchaeota archaeon]
MRAGLKSCGNPQGVIPPGALYMISFNESKKNARLTQFEDIKYAVIANVVKHVPEIKKVKETKANKTLTQFQ